MGDKKLPVFMQDEAVGKIFREAIECTPKKAKIYLVGGAARNSVYYRYFGKILSPRDYDLYFVGNPKKFISNLRKVGFIYGNMKRKDEITVKKKKFIGAKNIGDFVVFDIHFSRENIVENLNKKANFTINGFALPLDKVISPNWYKSIISVKNAERDLRNKQIRVNSYDHPAQLYACIRFIHKGFRKPDEKEIEGLLFLLGKLPKYKFKRNLKKVFGGAGGEKNARRIAKDMGIKEDIFSFKTIKKIRDK